jgi:hypothetical protein
MIKTLLTAALLASSSIVFAQATPPGDAAKAREERRMKLKAAQEKARKACEAKKGDEHRECMRHEMCAQTKDPSRCEARVKERASQRAKIREACKDKKGEDLRACIGAQRGK